MVKNADKNVQLSIVGEAVIGARKAAGLTQVQLAERAGVSRQSIIGLEADRASTQVLKGVVRELDLRFTGVARGKTIFEQIQSCRVRRGWTINELARKARLSPATVRSLEMGRGRVSSLNAILIELAPSARRQEPMRPHWSPGAPDARLTPPWLIKIIEDVFGPITLDPCAHQASFVRASRHIFEGECGLKSTWHGSDLAFCNPPFSELVRWIERCHQAWITGEAETIFGLFPVRSDSDAYHTKIFGLADILQLRGRLRFHKPDGQEGHQAPFPIMFVVWGAKRASIKRFRELVPCAHIPPTDEIVFASRAP